MTPGDRDGPTRLLAVTARVVPAGSRDWAQAMQAELAVVAERADRWSFAWGCVRTAALQLHLLRAAVHLLVTLGTLATLLAWIATVDYPPLAWVLYPMVVVLSAVCWEARRAGMLGPIGDGAGAWVLRACGNLTAGGIAAVAVAHAHPATLEATDDGVGLLVLAAVPAGFLIGLVTVCARRSAATVRVLLTGAGSGFGATVLWLSFVVVAPPIPVSVGSALVATGVAAAGAVLANSGRSGTIRGRMLAGLLATTSTMALIFAAVVVLARLGPDRLIPAITPHAPAANRIAESRIEIVDPYTLILVLGGLAATALSLAAVLSRRRVAVAPRPARS